MLSRIKRRWDYNKYYFIGNCFYIAMGLAGTLALINLFFISDFLSTNDTRFLGDVIVVILGLGPIVGFTFYIWKWYANYWKNVGL